MKGSQHISQFIGARGIIALTLLLCFASSCNKFTEIDPPINAQVPAQVFANDETVKAAISGLYSSIALNSGNSRALNSGVTIYAGMYGDELGYARPVYDDDLAFVNNALLPNEGAVLVIWEYIYKYLYTVNAIIEGVEASSGVSSSFKEQTIAEMKFVRAFCHFYLVNLFGDIPYVNSADYRENMVKPRTSEEEVYAEIISDLEDAIAGLPVEYISAERARPNKHTAQALLARVYLYQQQWVKAEELASAVINAGPYQLESDLDQVFAKSSTEAIWHLSASSGNDNTAEGRQLTPSSSGIPKYFVINELLNDFEAGDARRVEWVGSTNYLSQTWYYPKKYVGYTGTNTQYYIMFRLAEMYLIRAEARAQQDRLPEAIQDLDLVRARSGLPLIQNTNPSISKPELLDKIMQERRIELFSEWGHRWFDLKRTGMADVVLGPIKLDLEDTDIYWPIPETEILNNPSLTQNPGY